MSGLTHFKKATLLLEVDSFDVLLFDYKIGDDSGLELAKWVASKSILSPIILLTGMADSDLDLEARHCGASDYLIKQDLSAAVLERSIRYAIRQKSDEQKLLELASF